jgi:hypothetical protein
MECQIEGNNFQGKAKRNDEFFKGEISVNGILIADNVVTGTLNGIHSEVPDLELTGTFSLFQ